MVIKLYYNKEFPNTFYFIECVINVGLLTRACGTVEGIHYYILKVVASSHVKKRVGLVLDMILVTSRIILHCIKFIIHFVFH